MLKNINPLVWSWDQWKSAGRNIASYAAGLGTMLVAFHIFSPEQAQEFRNDVSSIVADLEKLAADIAALIGMLVPVYTALRAAHSASSEQRKDAIAQEPGTVVVEGGSREVIAGQIAALSTVNRVITTSEIAKSSPSDKIVTSAQASA